MFAKVKGRIFAIPARMGTLTVRQVQVLYLQFVSSICFSLANLHA
jgi:hypothetical protein